MRLTLTKDAATKIRLPHRAGDFVFNPHCEKEVPEELAKAMLKDSNHLYVEATDDNMKSAAAGAKLNKNIDAEAEKKMAAEKKQAELLKAEFEKGKAAAIAEMESGEPFQKAVASATAKLTEEIEELKAKLTETNKKLKEALR